MMIEIKKSKRDLCCVDGCCNQGNKTVQIIADGEGYVFCWECAKDCLGWHLKRAWWEEHEEVVKKVFF